MSIKVPENFRIKDGPLRSDESFGNNGLFIIRSLKVTGVLRVIVSDQPYDGETWEHVSVSLHNRCPTWDEMCFIKDLFWDEDDVVIQYHPAKKDYVNFHPYTLHLWRSVDQNIPTPPSIMVGPKNNNF